jgi:hypothetical protein
MLGDFSFIVNVIVAEECPVQICLNDGEEVRRKKDAWVLVL